MIEQKVIFEAFQIAFGTHHNKFPWPKKHSLEEQNDKFKRAFLAASVEINSAHNKATEKIKADNYQVGVNKGEQNSKDLVTHYSDLANHRMTVIVETRDERDEAISSRRVAWTFFTVLLLGIIGFFILASVIEPCVPQSEVEQFDFRFADSVVAYDKFGNTEITSICNF